MNTSKLDLQVEKMKAISHPHRLCIIKGLIDSSCNVSRIQECLQLPQSTVSQHLSKLKAAGIVKGDRNGLEIRYSVVDEEVMAITNIIFEDIDK